MPMKINLENIERISTTENIGRKNFGEVFTPNKLIDEMLNVLPSEVWTNPTLKWLDPAAGNGNFFAQVFNRLMIGLKTEIKNEEDREKHILENMLFFAELQSKNANNIKRGSLNITYREPDLRVDSIVVSDPNPSPSLYLMYDFLPRTAAPQPGEFLGNVSFPLTVNGGAGPVQKNITVTFQAKTPEGQPFDFKALETEKHSGIFVGNIFPVPGC